MQRVIAYVDGFNLYFGLRSQGLRGALWLDIPSLMSRFLAPGQSLVATKYFTSHLSGPPDKARRQSVYLEALASRPGVELFFGQYQTEQIRCRACGERWPVNREKMTDVNIAVELMKDAMRDRLDIAFLVSADSDLAGPVAAFRELWPAKRILAIFPPGRGSIVLERLANGKRRIRRNLVLASQMPDEVIGPDGYAKHRPPAWRSDGQGR